MEKNRIRPITNGKSMRMSYQRQKEVLEMPNLIEVQKDSYNWFLEEGLKEVFADISPITDYSGKLSLEFVDFTLCEDDVKYSIEECKERDATYAAPLKVKVDARGVIVVTECDHMCMAMRGVKKAQSRTVTSAVRGCMRDAATRTEAMSLILSNHS